MSLWCLCSCTDVSISGTVPIDEAQFAQPVDWPYAAKPESQYGAEAGAWKSG
jgi:hypothetical protein